MNAKQSAQLGAQLARAANRSGSWLPDAGWYPVNSPVVPSKACASPINHMACFHRVATPREDGVLLCMGSRELREGCKWATVVPMGEAQR